MNGILPVVLIGIVLIFLGLMVKRFPMLIAGYNTMSSEKKKNVDIEGLASFAQRHFIILGTLWIALAVLLKLVGEQDALPTIYLIYTPIYLIWIVIRSQRFDHNEE